MQNAKKRKKQPRSIEMQYKFLVAVEYIKWYVPSWVVTCERQIRPYINTQSTTLYIHKSWTILMERLKDGKGPWDLRVWDVSMWETSRTFSASWMEVIKAIHKPTDWPAFMGHVAGPFELTRDEVGWDNCIEAQNFNRWDFEIEKMWLRQSSIIRMWQKVYRDGSWMDARALRNY